MATAGVDSSTSDHSNHLHSESIPSIDLHLFSQAELFSLSLCSASSSLHQHQNDPDVSTLKIDRSVFNESAGSRKQTFSRIRLAPRNSSHFPPSSSIYASTPHQTADQTLDDDSPQIVALLKSLIGGNSVEVGNIEDNLVSVPVQYNGFVENPAVRVSDCNGDAETKEMVVDDSNAKKRKRGGPRREESNSISRLEEFGNMEDPYARELNRRTLDMQTKEQLLEFLQGLDGEWLSNRKKRKVVGASALGDFLPSGWKIMLCLMKRAGYFWVDCRRYISPNGQQFMSFKEASSYLNSSLGLQDANQLSFGNVDSNIQMTEEKSSANAADLTHVGKNEGALVCFSEPVQHEEKSVEVGIRGQDGTVRNYKCHKCTMIFYEPDDLLQHFLSSHKKVPKRVGQETLNEEVIFNNGRYECQFCDKSYDERHRYNGHLGNHIKDYFKRIHASGEEMKIKRSTIPSLVAAHPSTAKIQESYGTDIGSVVTNSNSQSNDENNDVLACKIKENATDLVCCMNDSKPGDSNDIVAVENNSVHQVSPKCSRAAVEMEQLSAPDNIVNQHVNLNNGHAHKIGSDSKLVAQAAIDDAENIKGRLLSNAINSSEIHDKDFVRADVSANNCSSQEDVAANGIEQIDLEGCLLIPFGNDQKYAVLSNAKVNQVSTSAMKESWYSDIGGSNNNVLSVGSGCNNVTVEDFATVNELESSSMKSEGRQLTSFASEQCPGSENTITNQADVLCAQNSTHKKGVDLVASHVTAVELESISGNSLHIPSGNELTFSFEETEVLNGAPDNLQGKNSESNFHKPTYDDQILKYENNVKMFSLSTVDQPKEKEVKRFFKGDTHNTFDGTRIEWDADADKSTIQESYFNDCSLVSSGSQWNATGVNVTGQYCSPLDEHKQASAKCFLNLSNSVEDWSAGNNSDRLFTGEFKEKLKVVKPRKNDTVTGFSSNIQATENAMSDFMWKHDEESYLLRYTDTSGVANSSGCFTTYDLLSDKGPNELFGEKFSGFSGFEGLRSDNIMNNPSEENKVFSDDTEAIQRLGSSHRLEKEALPLLPNIGGKRHVLAVCVWCKNEFQNEYFESQLQIGSSNPTCAACKAKFSSNFSLL